MSRGGLGSVTLAAALLLAACSSGVPEVQEVADPPAATTKTPSGDVATPTATDEGATTTAAPTDEVTESAQPPDSATGTADPPEETGEEVIEVEPGAAFVSPSTNIACYLAEGPDGAGYVACDIDETDNPIELPPPDDVPAAWESTLCEDPSAQTSTLLLAGGEVFWNCSHEPISIAASLEIAGGWVGDGPTAELWDGTPLAVLAYGQTLRTPTHECLSARDGVTCQDIDGEHGLTVSRSGLQTW